VALVQAITEEVEVGKKYHGKVTRLMNFGAFIEILPGKEGLVHISDLANERVGRVEDVVKPGDEIDVLVKEIDAQGRINLSRRALLEGYDPTADTNGRERSGGFRGGDRGPGGGGFRDRDRGAGGGGFRDRDRGSGGGGFRDRGPGGGGFRDRAPGGGGFRDRAPGGGFRGEGGGGFRERREGGFRDREGGSGFRERREPTEGGFRDRSDAPAPSEPRSEFQPPERHEEE